MIFFNNICCSEQCVYCVTLQRYIMYWQLHHALVGCMTYAVHAWLISAFDVYGCFFVQPGRPPIDYYFIWCIRCPVTFDYTHYLFSLFVHLLDSFLCHNSFSFAIGVYSHINSDSLDFSGMWLLKEVLMLQIW